MPEFKTSLDKESIQLLAKMIDQDKVPVETFIENLLENEYNRRHREMIEETRLSISQSVNLLTAAFMKSYTLVQTKNEGLSLRVEFNYKPGDIPSYVLALYNAKAGRYESARKTALEDMFISILAQEGDDDDTGNG